MQRKRSKRHAREKDKWKGPYRVWLQINTRKGEVYYSVDKYQWRCKAINQQNKQNDAVLDFDLAFVVNNGNARVVGNRLEGYEHEW